LSYILWEMVEFCPHRNFEGSSNNFYINAKNLQRFCSRQYLNIAAESTALNAPLRTNPEKDIVILISIASHRGYHAEVLSCILSLPLCGTCDVRGMRFQLLATFLPLILPRILLLDIPLTKFLILVQGGFYPCPCPLSAACDRPVDVLYVLYASSLSSLLKPLPGLSPLRCSLPLLHHPQKFLHHLL
jgi:hypothetical protein